MRGNEGGIELEKQSPWRVSPRGLLVLAAVFVVVAGVLLWLKARVALALLGATGGAFVGAMVCPLIGGEEMLGDLRRGVAKCLGVGVYLVGGAWIAVVGLKDWLAHVLGSGASVSAPAAVILVLVVTVGFLVKVLWPDSRTIDTALVSLGAVIGVIAVLSLSAVV